ncbi:MAG: 30S ribosomal protein S9 [Candidatus Gastranaerophilales bacterium]|jgi:small subunit ribosomal protein S9|nr:30S ribosomal protein S9 [Candidatus Gastranaerophilales bacterium]
MAILKEAVGRRKTAIATVKLRKGKGRIFINNKPSSEYLGNRAALEMMILQPLELTNNAGQYDIIVKAVGGGISSQAGAIRHGLSKALLGLNTEENKSVLKENGLLTRDSRIKERKKYGRKRARKRFQFSKR